MTWQELAKGIYVGGFGLVLTIWVGDSLMQRFDRWQSRRKYVRRQRAGQVVD